jgi:RNA polymerase sigma-70 factor, ECF subfamily
MSEDQWISQLEPHRNYLEVLAESRIEPKLRRKIDAPDVVQDTFVAAYIARKSMPKSDDPDDIRRWLVTILKNKLTDIRRKFYGQKRDLLQENSVEIEMNQSAQGIEAMVAAVQTSPSGAAIRREHLMELAKAIRSLENDQREVIVEKYINNRTLAEISQDLGKTEKSVAGLLYRGMLSLKELLV